MAKATFGVLGEQDKQLVLETEPRQLETLDEDDLLALFTLVRRARNKHTKLYRRAAAQRVATNRARAQASRTHARDRARAEVLEEALARVSRRLAVVASATAQELRTSRLDAARAVKGGAKQGGAETPAAGKPTGTAKAKRKAKTPASKRARAADRATGKRKQAKRDARR